MWNRHNPIKFCRRGAKRTQPSEDQHLRTASPTSKTSANRSLTSHSRQASVHTTTLGKSEYTTSLWCRTPETPIVVQLANESKPNKTNLPKRPGTLGHHASIDSNEIRFCSLQSRNRVFPRVHFPQRLR